MPSLKDKLLGRDKQKTTKVEKVVITSKKTNKK